MGNPDRKRNFLYSLVMGAGLTGVAACGSERPGVQMNLVDCKGQTGPRSNVIEVVVPPGQNLQVADKLISSEKPGNVRVISGSVSSERPLSTAPEGQVIFPDEPKAVMYTVSSRQSTTGQGITISIKADCIQR